MVMYLFLPAAFSLTVSARVWDYPSVTETEKNENDHGIFRPTSGRARAI